VVLFFPEGPLIISKGISGTGIPQEMVDSLGPPVQVNSGEELRKFVEA